MNKLQTRKNSEEEFQKSPLELIDERNQKSLFLVFFLPWLTSVAASLASTVKGYVFLLFPKRIEETLLASAIVPSLDEAGYITIVIVCNLISDLAILLILMLQKHKIKINLLRISLALLLGHTISGGLYLLVESNQDMALIVNAITTFWILVSLYFVVMRFFQKKYIEILSDYWEIYVFRELQFLSRYTISIKEEKNSKSRLKLNIFSLLLKWQSIGREKDLIQVIRKWRDIDSSSKKLRTSIDHLSSYLHSKLKYNPEILKSCDFDKLGVLDWLILSFDRFLSFGAYSSVLFPRIVDLVYKAQHPVNNNDFSDSSLSELSDNKSIKKIIKFHLSRAREADAISAKQKLYALIFVSFVYLASPTLIFLVSSNNAPLLFNGDRFVILIFQYFSTFVLTSLAVHNIEKRYRREGVSIHVSKVVFHHLMNVIIVLIFLVTVIVGNKAVYELILGAFLRNFNLLLLSIALMQILLLILFINPPVELRKPEIATSLLVRELMFLRSQVFSFRSLRGRKFLSRHFYLLKKYLGYIKKSLVNFRYDSKYQKDHIKDYFDSINLYVDRLSSDLKLGGISNRDNIILQIEKIIYLVAVEKFGEIPSAIPEIKSHIETKSIQPRKLGYLERLFQLFDTSWLVRITFLLLITILINLLNPSLWEHLQNLSSLYGILTP